jgi:hypothetical protein
MNTNELISYANSHGFSINEKENKYLFQFKKEPNLIFEFFIPKVEFSIKDGTALEWDVNVKDLENKKEYNIWAEEYGQMDSSSKWDSMRNSYKDFIDTVTKNEIRLFEHCLFTIFRKKFFEKTDVQYKSNNNWENIFL